MNTETDMKKDDGCGGGSCCSGLGKWIWSVLAVAVAGVLIAKYALDQNAAAGTPAPDGAATAAAAAPTGPAPGAASVAKSLPRLVDLGAGKCIPCKLMAPILAELKTNYAGRIEVQFIDVWENPEAGKKYGINLIPTQIFYDAEGKELFRHEGFFGKDDILAKWKSFGVDLGPLGKHR